MRILLILNSFGAATDLLQIKDKNLSVHLSQSSLNPRFKCILCFSIKIISSSLDSGWILQIFFTSCALAILKLILMQLRGPQKIPSREAACGPGAASWTSLM